MAKHTKKSNETIDIFNQSTSKNTESGNCQKMSNRINVTQDGTYIFPSDPASKTFEVHHENTRSPITENSIKWNTIGSCAPASAPPNINSMSKRRSIVIQKMPSRILLEISSVHHIVKTFLLKKEGLLPLEYTSTTYHPHFISCLLRQWKSATPVPVTVTIPTTYTPNVHNVLVKTNLHISTGVAIHVKTCRICASGPWESVLEISRYLQIMVSKSLIISMVRFDTPFKMKNLLSNPEVTTFI
jgi:hypothetical protein